MPRWDDGYVTDVAYTDNVYREMTPTWLALTALLLGQRPPDLSRPFRYADLGCGLGMTALFVAASCPQAEVWGFDFNPAHIAAARQCAADAGLGNVTFVETSFADLAAKPPAALPEFDFIVAHGVLSWISPANRTHMVDVIGQRLRAGGLAYVSYNTLTGWASMVPVRALMRLLAEAGTERSDQAAITTLDMMERVRGAGARFFAQHPDLQERLATLRKQNTRYLAHEFLNADWHPMMCADVMTSMAEARCTYVGSASLAENIDVASVPPDMAPMLAQYRDPRIRETLRDLGMAGAFRRDVYRRGMVPLLPQEQMRLLEQLRFTRIGALPEAEVSFTTPIGILNGRPEVYQPLLAMLRRGPATLGELHRADPARGWGEVVQAISLLTSGGQVHPMLPDPAAGIATAGALNAWIGAVNEDGGEMQRLVAPAIGSMIAVDLLETFLVRQLLAGAAPRAEPLAERVLAQLRGAGRSLQRDGQTLNDPTEARQHAVALVQTMLDQRVPLLRDLGMLPPA